MGGSGREKQSCQHQTIISGLYDNKKYQLEQKKVVGGQSDYTSRGLDRKQMVM